MPVTTVATVVTVESGAVVTVMPVTTVATVVTVESGAVVHGHKVISGTSGTSGASGDQW
jgi:hypothetical protein